MPKLHVELDGPIIKPDGVIILKDGQPLTNVTHLIIALDADTGGLPVQAVSLGQHIIMDGIPYKSDVSHTIRKATLTIEYQEA